jgi:hypothetical protein
MDDEDSDVVFEEEWEEVQGPQVPAAPATAATDNGDITIYLNGALVAWTPASSTDCLQYHISSALAPACMLCWLGKCDCGT